MNFADTLLSEIRLAKAKFLSRDLSDKKAVRDELAFLYSCCVASERLLEEAAQELKRPTMKCQPWVSFNKELEAYYTSHLAEERGELPLLVEDLASAGVDVKYRYFNPAAIQLIGSQYYLIKHFHPAALLGYMAIQEADPTPIETVAALEERHGKDLFRFIRLHAIKDIEHAKELVELINIVPADLQFVLTYSVRHSLILYQRR